MTAPDPRLLVPLSCLPSVPVGAPLRHSTGCGYVALPHLMDDPETIWCIGPWVSGRPGLPERRQRANLSIDLTPPDPPGSRVDGLDVGLRLLGWEAGEDVAAFLRPQGSAPGRLVLLLAHAVGQPRVWLAEAWASCPGAVVVPTLADIDSDDPLALRLAVSHVLQAGGAR